MYRILYGLVLVFLLASCGEQKKPSVLVLDPKFKAQLLAQGNVWADEALWGEAVQTRDTSGKTPLDRDDRVHDVYKKNLGLKDKYVLWRMAHNGTCWLQAQMIQLFYGLILAGPTKFRESIEALENHNDIKAIDPAIAKKLLDVFRMVELKPEIAFFLEISTRQHIFDALNMGFRHILKQHGVSCRGGTLSPYSWGKTNDFCGIFKIIKEPFNNIGMDVLNEAILYYYKGPLAGEDNIYILYYDGSSLKDNKLVKKAEKKLIDQNYPPFITIMSKKSYIDLLVRTDLASK